MTRIGYCRYSTSDQHPEAQHDALTDAGCERIFTDAGVSGKLARRPQLDAALDYLQEGDALVITKLDRLGRSVRNLVEEVANLHARRVDLIVLHQGIDTTTPRGKLLFHVMAAVAEFERDLIAERTREGLRAARARGRSGGRPPALSPAQAKLAREMYDATDERGVRKYTVAQIGGILGCSRPAVYYALEHTPSEAKAG